MTAAARGMKDLQTIRERITRHVQTATYRSERPSELRFRHLDPSRIDEPEMIATGTHPWRAGAAMGLRYIVIVENKDTYQEMPMIRDGLCVFGSGSAAPNGLRLLPFLYDDSASELRAIYWGDMDADGLEILAAVRGTGIECESLFMDRTAYDRYRRYGTDKDEHGRTIARHACKPMSGLHAKEQELYETLCEGGSATYPRIEQERIPLSTAAEELRSRNVPAVDL